MTTNKMRTRGLIATALAAVLAVPGALLASNCHPGAGGEHGSHAVPKSFRKAKKAKRPKTVIIRGEVVDLSCYMTHLGRGEKHKRCALDCLSKGAAAGVLTRSGKVYLIVAGHSKRSRVAYGRLKKLAGERVKLTGHKFVRGGLTAVAIQAVSSEG